MYGMSSKTYSVAWDEVLDNVINISGQLANNNLDFLIFNRCSEPQNRPGWVEAEDVRYYGHFYNSLKDFMSTDHSIFIFNAGDVYSDEQAEFTQKVERVMGQDADIWLMGPRMTNDGGDGEATLIDMSKRYNGEFGLAIHFNGIWVAMSRELAEITLKYVEWLLEKDRINFRVNVTGHCLDTVYAMVTLYNNKKAYRDWTVTMECGVDTSYPTNGALNDCQTVTRGFFDYASIVGYNVSSILNIYRAIEDKIYGNRTGGYPIQKAYPRHQNIQEFKY
jgi:hypothetical protein